MNPKMSAKYKDFISKSIRLHSGPPAVYQLKPKKEVTDTVTRMIIGERNPNKLNKNILLVGETGTGKSTLINALLNYSMGVKWEDEVWFQIVMDEKRSQAESQTSDVIVYEIYGFEDGTLPFSLTIIDTPGFGDTRGTDKDDIVMKRLFTLFRSENGVHDVHAVGLVLKASENRLSDRQIYIFSSVMSLFGKDVENHIVAFITHSDGVKPKNALEALEAANIKSAKNAKNEAVYFLFNNQQFKERTEEEEIGLENAWRVTERGLRQFKVFIEKNPPQKTKETAEVMNERITLTACIQNLEERIRLAEQKQREIRQINEALQKHKDEMEENKNFTIEVDEVYKEKEDIKGGFWGLLFYEGAVCCKVCEETCHYPECTVAWSPKDCEVMKRGRCTVCTGKCAVSDHVKEEWKYVIKTRKVIKTLENIKEKFEKNQSERKNKSNFLETLKNQMSQLREEKKQFLDQSYQHLLRLEQIALKADAPTTIGHLNFLIEKMMEEGETVKVQRLQKMRSGVDEGVSSALRERFCRLFKK